VCFATQGFPAANEPGQPDLFRIARQVLPGPVSLPFILTHIYCIHRKDAHSARVQSSVSKGCSSSIVVIF